MQAQFAAAHDNPLRQNLVVEINPVCQFHGILQSLGTGISFLTVFLDFIEQAVYQRKYGIDQIHLGALADILTLVLRNTVLRHKLFVANQLKLLIQILQFVQNILGPKRKGMKHLLHDFVFKLIPL